MLTVNITEGHAHKLGLKSSEILKVHDVGYITEICRSGAYLYFIVGEIIDCEPMLLRLWRDPEPVCSIIASWVPTTMESTNVPRTED
jgi:hypothetical protein